MQHRLRVPATVLGAVALPLLVGCSGGYDDGYQAGFAAGFRSRDEEVAALREQGENCDSSGSSYSFGDSSAYTGAVVTEVCGGGGVNVGKKHYAPGKTGCVRVFSDGRVERY